MEGNEQKMMQYPRASHQNLKSIGATQQELEMFDKGIHRAQGETGKEEERINILNHCPSAVWSLARISH